MGKIILDRRPSRSCAARLTAVLLLLAGGLGAGPAAAQRQGLPSGRMLPLGLATEAAEAARAACEQQGYRVSVAVVDRAGLVKALIRSDGAGPASLDSASRKAYTSASLRRATLELAEMVAGNPAVAELGDLNERILILGGGLPIKAGEEVIGGIGVGGAPGADKDQVCAQAGIDKLGDRLG